MLRWKSAFVAVLVAMLAGHALCQTPAVEPQHEENIPAPAATDAIGLADLEQLALQRNPTLVQAGAQVSISRGAAVQAGLLPNPTVGYIAEQMGASGTAGELHGLFIEQEIVTGGKLELSRAKYAEEARQAEI